MLNITRLTPTSSTPIKTAGYAKGKPLQLYALLKFNRWQEIEFEYDDDYKPDAQDPILKYIKNQKKTTFNKEGVKIVVSEMMMHFSFDKYAAY